MHYNVTRPDGETVNVLAWFGNSDIDGCQNALLLQGGDLLLLKTERVIRHDELKRLRKDYQAWVETIGTNYASDELRAALAHFDAIRREAVDEW